VNDDDDLWAQADTGDVAIRVRLVVANVIGAALVGLVIVIAGVPDAAKGDPARGNIISGLALLAYLAVVLPAELFLSLPRIERLFAWVQDRREPHAEEIIDVFAFPWVQARRIFGYWLGAAVLFTAINLGFGNNLAYCLRVGLDIALGGLTSSALSFLLLERFNRPVFALALAGEPSQTMRRLGLRRRLLLTWVLGAAVPVVAIVSAPAGLSAQRRADLSGPLLVVGVVALGAGLVLTVLAARSITEPIEALRVGQRRVGDGDLDVGIPVDDGGEVGQLQAGFNRMVAGLRERQRIRDLFGRHVGDEVARHALSEHAELGGELREASALFVDVIGSTKMAQQLPPTAVVAVLNDFFSVVVRCAAEHGGWVNKFEGDAALCVFGPPADDADHAARALRAARSMRGSLAALAARHPGFDAGIGVSTGTVVAGNVGDAERYEYTLIGDPVNEAARLTEEAKAEAGRVLASGAAIDRAGAEAEHWERLDARVLRGRAEATEIYAPRG
jgi:adenylate cyclase